MSEYFHSVILDEEKCIGCTNCVKRCPTEAIRVKNGKAKIIKNRCIDCGECIRICPQHAKKAITDPIEVIHDYKYKIALPAPTLLGQFKNTKSPVKILSALKMIGFNDVFEVSRGADIVTHYTKKLIDENPEKIFISSACPAIVRLIQVRFPDLIDNLILLDSPMETAAKIARSRAMRLTHYKAEEIGIFFISPCSAKVTSVKNPLGRNKSNVDGVLSISDVYPLIQKNLKKAKYDVDFYNSGTGIGWARPGGEAYSLGVKNYLSIDGIENVIDVLDELENGKIKGVRFIEAVACINGCTGGPLTIENRFITRRRIRELSEKYPKIEKVEVDQFDMDDFKYEEKIEERNVNKLGNNILEAMAKMKEIEKIYNQLPDDLDCGACGSPSCKTLAEDIALGYADLYDCIVLYKDKTKAIFDQTVIRENTEVKQEQLEEKSNDIEIEEK